MKYRKWYKLDNVGTFYASLSNIKIPNVFRYSALMNDNIEENILQTALIKTLEIFPNFNVNLKKGIYWYYLQESAKNPIVTEENLPICFKLYNNDDDFLYRVSYFKNKINFEISHILSDGRGSMDFFKYLISQYTLLKYDITDIDINTSNSELERSEDSFSKYYNKKSKIEINKSKIYRYKQAKFANQTQFMELHLNVKDVINIAHKYNTTMTIFLVSLLIFSFKSSLKVEDLSKTIRIDIPVDLRKFFKSTSSRNFFGLFSVDYTFKTVDDQLEEIIESIKKQFKENLTAEKLSNRMNKMVSFEKNPFLKPVPIFIKNFLLKIIDSFTSKLSSSCFSNVGIINLNEKISKYVKNISVLSSTNTFQFISCSYKDTLTIGISSRFRYNDIIKNFCRYFSENNLKTEIYVSEVI